MKDKKNSEQLEEGLQENEKSYKDLFDNIPLSYQSLNTDGCFIDINPSWLRTLGYEREEVIGKWFGDFLHPDWKPHFKKNFQTFKKQGYVSDVQFKIRHKNGHYLDISFEGYIGYKSDRSFKQTYCVFMDITRHKQVEEKIKHLNLVLRTIRNVNQLIIEEKNRDVLIQKACNILTENRGFINAWIVLLGEQGEYLNSAESGLGENFLPLKKMMEKGKLTDCGNRTLKKKDIVIVEDPHRECRDCPLSKNYVECGGYTSSLRHGNSVYGLLTVAIPSIFIKDKEEQGLLLEVSRDIGFALNSIKVEKNRQLAIDDLKKEKEFSAKIINTSNAIIIGLDIDHKIQLFNEGAEKSTGYKKAEVMGEDWFQIFFPAEMFEEMDKVWKDAWGVSYHSYENLILSKTGEKRMISWQNTGIYEGEDEKYHLLISIGEDITERNRGEAELLVKNAVFEESNTANSISDNEGTIIYVNNTFVKIFGYSDKEEAIGKPISDFLKYEGEAMNIIKALNEAGVWEGEYSGLRKDGTTFDAYGMATIIRDKFGDRIGYQSAVLDVSERKRIEEDLIIERDNMKRIFEAMEDGICIVNEQYGIQYVNPVLQKSFGIYKGRKCYEYFHDRTEVCPWCKNSEVFEGKTVRWEWLSPKNGKTYDLIDTKLKNSDGSVSKLEIFRDITDRKKAEEEILRLKDGLEIQVVEKTKELNEKISELERFHDATIDREFRIKELNDRIEELETELKKYKKGGES